MGLQGPNTIVTIVFGLYNPVIWVLRPLGLVSGSTGNCALGLRLGPGLQVSGCICLLQCVCSSAFPKGPRTQIVGL